MDEKEIIELCFYLFIVLIIIGEMIIFIFKKEIIDFLNVKLLSDFETQWEPYIISNLIMLACALLIVILVSLFLFRYGIMFFIAAIILIKILLFMLWRSKNGKM